MDAWKRSRMLTWFPSFSMSCLFPWRWIHILRLGSGTDLITCEVEPHCWVSLTPCLMLSCIGSLVCAKGSISYWTFLSPEATRKGSSLIVFEICLFSEHVLSFENITIIIWLCGIVFTAMTDPCIVWYLLTIMMDCSQLAVGNHKTG